ncbi:MAG: DNA polymerase IV [Clostridia bacterium]|nr:DNA polymerase IV [Clostridia bacterium]
MRTILHVDLNNFYASVEILLNPSLKGKFVAVCGSVENRHGIVLAKSENAKKMGVKTGMTIKEAEKLCPELVFVEANHKRFDAYSKLVRNIYRDYTDKIESFGIDECWLDCTNSLKMFKSGRFIADDIRRRVKEEIGLTVSVGVSFNKVFAKLGSDLKKPDGTTVIDYDNFKEKVWNLPVGELLYVGKSMVLKLNKINIKTIGELALTDKDYLVKHFGKWGGILHDYALGLDTSEVSSDGEEDEIKSVGNSMTSYRDIETIEDASMIFTILAESVSSRLISYNVGKATSITVYMRDENLFSITRQCALDNPSVLPEDFHKKALELFIKNRNKYVSYRTLGLSVKGFETVEQLNFYDNDYEEKLKLNTQIDKIRQKYGSTSVIKGNLLNDKKLMKTENEKTSLMHPDKR